MSDGGGCERLAHLDCPCEWTEGQVFPCPTHRHLSQAELERLLFTPVLQQEAPYTGLRGPNV